MKILPKNLSDRDIRAISIGAVAMALIILFCMSSSWLENWRYVRKSISEKKAQLKQLASSGLKQKGLLEIVPVFNMPQPEETQEFLFRNNFNEQLKKVGIKNSPLETLTSRKNTKNAGYKLLTVKTSCEKCRFSQIIDLLVTLIENPYLVAIEELNIKCNPNNREEFRFDIEVSTFVK